MNILLIEDELPAARQLTKLLTKQVPGCNILETLDSVQGAVRWLRNFPAPDLMFMDIQIADGLSFDIFRQVTVPAPVIFTTAFDQYAVQAFKVNALDYLLKPIDPEDLQKALDRVQERRKVDPTASMEALLSHFQAVHYKERFLVKTGQHMVFIAAADIAYFHSSGGLTMAYLFSGKKYFVDHTLEELDTLLDPKKYFRVSRALMLRIDAIRKIHPHLNGRLKLDTQPGAPEEAYVSRDRASDFKRWLGG